MVRVEFDDFAEADAKATASGPQIPVGRHEVTIASAEDTTSSRGTPGLKVFLDDGRGGKIETKLWITPKTEANTLMFLRAVGYQPEAGTPIEMDPEVIKGRRVSVRIQVEDEEKDDGEVVNTVAFKSWRGPEDPNPAIGLPTAAEIKRVTSDDIPF